MATFTIGILILIIALAVTLIRKLLNENKRKDEVIQNQDIAIQCLKAMVDELNQK